MLQIIMLFSLLAGAHAAVPTAVTTVSHPGAAWVLENSRLQVTIHPGPGAIQVLDRASGYTWKQPVHPAAPSSAPLLFPRRPTPIIDGDLQEWTGKPSVRLTYRMTTADAPKVDSNQDCSANVWCAWDDQNFYLAARVTDDILQFGPPDNPTWWEKDSLEFWIGSRQIGLSLVPNGSQARTVDGPVPGARVAMRVQPGGYSVEAAIPWTAFPDAPPRRAGQQFPFAVGVNDADATGTREGQLYFPTTWVHSDPSTFATAILADASGAAPSSTPAPGADRFRDIRRIPHGIAFTADFGATRGKPNTVRVSLELPDGASDLAVTADVADRNAPIDSFAFLDPFLLDTRQGVMAVADYCNGHLYPLDLEPFPRPYFSADRLDMPWVGLTDLQRGIGYALILETSDDAAVRADKQPAGNRRITAPQVIWSPSLGHFRYPRRLLYRFVSKGGYVALALAYRAYAQQQGLIVPFSEKLKKNPNIRRLFGAPDVWGNASLAFARQAKAAGVEKMLIQGPNSPADMKAVRGLGYLPSEYDNYTDILPTDAAHPVDSNHDLVPQHVVLQANGQRMAAWKTWEGLQYMKRCPDFWVPAAQQVIPKVLKQYPFVGRFIDVTTAEGLYECCDPQHPLTRSDKRQKGQDLLHYVRSQGLVVGGEHGIWWGVPHLDYIEGMMSSSYYSWPAGYLIHPTSKDQPFTDPSGHKLGPWEDYARWGIGYQWRAPLWELVFHDCVVSTWYWGDASDFLLQAAPEITPRKDAFNILYGTIPLLWANREGAWEKDRAVFLRTYRNTCKLHEVLAGARMLDHQFLTPDHSLQRTRFSNGVQVTVNFGKDPAAVTFHGQKVLLPENGWVVSGPQIDQSRIIRSGRIVTTIRAPGYFYSDAGAAFTARAAGKDEIRLLIDHWNGPVSFRPADVETGWDMSSTRIYALNANGVPVHPVPFTASGGQFHLTPSPGDTSLTLFSGSRSYFPALRVQAGPAVRTKQGQKVQLTAVVSNAGRAPARDMQVAFYADAAEANRRLGTQTLVLAPGQRRSIRLTVDTGYLDGSHQILAVAGLKGAHPVPAWPSGSQAVIGLDVVPDYSRWPHRRRLQAAAGALDRQDAIALAPLSLPDADPASVRVVELDADGRPARMLPAQWDLSGPGNGDGKGELCVLLHGSIPAGASRRLMILWADHASRSAFLAPPSRSWDASARTIHAESYRAGFQDGSLVDIAARNGAGYGKPFLGSLIFSSAATGWTDEPGAVESFQALYVGPVRTVIRVRKRLKTGMVYQKTYSFYPRRFDVEIQLDQPFSGVYSRAYYLRPGEYNDSGGFKARVDGQGNEEGVSGKARQPRWYTVSGDDWAHSCISLTPASSITYWDDSSAWGGIGFDTARPDQRLSYVIHSGKPAAGFAERDAAELSTPVVLSESALTHPP